MNNAKSTSFKRVNGKHNHHPHTNNEKRNELTFKFSRSLSNTYSVGYNAYNDDYYNRDDQDEIKDDDENQEVDRDHYNDEDNEEETSLVIMKGNETHKLHDKFLYNIIYNTKKDEYSLQEQDEYFEKITVKNED